MKFGIALRRNMLRRRAEGGTFAPCIFVDKKRVPILQTRLFCSWGICIDAKRFRSCEDAAAY